MNTQRRSGASKFVRMDCPVYDAQVHLEQKGRAVGPQLANYLYIMHTYEVVWSSRLQRQHGFLRLSGSGLARG